MKKRWIMAILVGLAAMATGPKSSNSSAQERRHNDRDFQQRDETRQNFSLQAGARIEVSSIRGPVEVQTSEMNEAEVHIIRSARTKNELAYHKILVEHTSSSLVVRGQQEDPERQPPSGTRVNHRVILRIPRHADLTVNSISGSVKIGDLNGKLLVESISGSVTIGKISDQVRINSISGNVKLEQASGYLDISGVSGDSFAAIARIEERGIRVDGISGQVELRFNTQLNADLNATRISGKVHLDVPNANVQGTPSASAVRARIGAGGSPIIINSVSGSVRLAPGT